MKKRYIYIIQMHTGTLPARFVQLMTRYQYSHVGLSFDPSCNVIYSFGRRSLHNILNGGFVAERKSGMFFQKYRETVCRIYAIEVSQEQYAKVRAAVKRMQREQAILKYDFLGAFLRFFHLRVSFKNHYVCSHFVAELLEDAQICAFQKSCCQIKPGDFDFLENKQEIYTGKYRLCSARALS